MQTRRAVGTARVRAKYGPSMRLWLHPRGSQVASGTAVAAVNDQSGRGVAITQATASKQPLKSAFRGVPSYRFDGVNDALEVAAIDFSATQGVTIAVVEYRSTAAFGTEYELTPDINFQTGGIGIYGNATAGDRWECAFRGNNDYQVREVASTAQNWRSFVAVANKALPAASEIKIYQSGAEITSYTTSLTSENTNTFANSTSWIGSRNNGASLPLSGSIAMLVVFNRALFAGECQALTLELAEAAGVGYV